MREVTISQTLCVQRLQLKAALAEILDQPGAVKPERVRFFRGQMQTIITRAVMDLGMKPVPSRRCFTLISAHPHRLPLGRQMQVLCDAIVTRASSFWVMQAGSYTVRSAQAIVLLASLRLVNKQLVVYSGKEFFSHTQ